MSSNAARPGGLAALGHLVFRTRNGLFPLVTAGLFLGFTPTPPLGHALDGWVDAVGLGLAFTGQLLRVVVTGFAYIMRGGRDRRIYAEDLVTEGLFAHCRNPMYVGNVAMYSGLALVHGNIWTIGLTVGFFGTAYLAVTLAEEGFLRSMFGDQYDAYCLAVPRFGFRFHGLRETLTGSRFDWQKVVRKEYGTVFAWISTVCVLLIWQDYARDPAGDWTILAARLGRVWVFAVLFYLVARRLKLTGRLGQDAPRGTSS